MVSVVVPVYRNGATLAELHRRLAVSVDAQTWELVLVDDHSPDDSVAVATALRDAHAEVKLIALPTRQGQHGAAFEGLRAARGDVTVVLDADLQDPPEATTTLLSRIAAGADAVFAGRRGAYETRGKLLTSRAMKRTLHTITGRRLPIDAGMYFAITRDVRERLIATCRAGDYLPVAIAHAAARVESVPVERAAVERLSAYTRRGRAGVALRAMHTTVRHNDVQRAYFRPSKPSMVPSDSPYVERQLDRLLEFGGIKPDQRVLEIGCGMGRYTIPLLRRGYNVEGIDLSSEQLERLRLHAPDLQPALHCGDVANPPASLHGPFDAAIGFFVLHHVHDLERIMCGVAPLLRPDATLAFLEPNPYNPLYYAQITLTPGMTWAGDGGIVRMRRQLVHGAFRAAGFVDPTLERFGMMPPQVMARPWGRRLEEIAGGWPLDLVRAFQLFGATARQ
jgi:2-polyprenyl-3-methyl-5-hydroxy-6-metoxy-1,4-benzoquinol methylase